MQSEQINASQLLGAFLGNESDKISQSIGRSDFAGELKRLIKEPADRAGELSKNAASKPANLNGLDSGSEASGGQAAGGTKTRGQSTGRVAPKTAIDSKTKAKELKSKAKAAESTFVTNSAVANTILADLQYPAETRQACKALQNKEGAIPVKELKSILDNQSTVSSAIPAVVPAEHVQELVNSIIAKGSSAEKQGLSAGSLQASVKVKSKGSYTRSEVLGVLDKVLQQAESVQAKSSDPVASTGVTQTIVKASGGLKASQTRSLTASVLPSFVSEDSEHSLTGKTVALEVKDTVPEAKTINVNGTGEDKAIEAASDKLEAFGIPNGSGYSREAAASAKAAGNESSAEATPDSAAVLSSAGKNTEELSVASLDSVLKSFDARIVSPEPQQAETKIVEAPVLGGSVGGSVAQAQNMASNVKGAEKEADRSLGAQSSSKQPQNSTENSGTVQIKTAPAEYPSSEQSFDSDKKGSADPTKKTDAQTAAEKFDSKTTAVNAEAVRNAEGETASGSTEAQAESLSRPDNSVEALAHGADSSTAALKKAAAGGLVERAEPEEIASQSGEAATDEAGKVSSASVDKARAMADTQTGKTESLSGRPKDSVEALAHGADSSTAALKKAVAVGLDEAKLEESAVQPRETVADIAGKTASAPADENSAKAGAQTTAPAESISEELRMELGMEDSQTGLDPSIYGAGAKTTLSHNDSLSATSRTDALDTAESRLALSGAEASLAKQIVKQSGNSDSTLEGMIFQNSASSIQGSDMNVARMENSAQNGSAYDPYSSTEFVQNMQELFGTASGRQLVIEMEPTELGKVSLKIEAKKDEISVAALTDNESARQVLVKHSPELRQGLQDQGLVLDKFTVDVNRDKASGGNYPEDSNTKGQNPRVAKGVRAVSGPSYTRQIDVRSQISIFA